MVKKVKSKHRLDKYYELAKEQGYRSRAAFKLIQLNRKFDFFSSATVCIDLCAAPGGWLQVAANNMPVSSFIIGTDLVPIKPIKGVTTFVGDITSPECFSRIRYELRKRKADIVLHDGAPNVGASWLKDAYEQNELVLDSLRLATKVLRPGGTFVTKIFRSADYNSLIWVFSKLFSKVTATKPMASRSESAEIFVVCQDFKAPGKIDPKLLDPKYVFVDIDEADGEEIISLKQLLPNKNKKQKGKIDHTKGIGQFRASPISDFVRSNNPFQFIADSNQFSYQDEDSKEMMKLVKVPKLFEEVCEDLKVLGRNEIKSLLNWRQKVKKIIDAKPKTQIEEQEADSEEELEELTQKARQKLKRQEKKLRQQEKRRKLSENNSGIIMEDEELFTMQDPSINIDDAINNVEFAQSDEDDESEDSFEYEDEAERMNLLEEQLNLAYAQDKARKKRKLDEEGGEDILKQVEAARWFQREEFDDIEGYHERPEMSEREKRKQRLKKLREKKTKQEESSSKVQMVPQEYKDEEIETLEDMVETVAIGKAMLRKKRRRSILESTYNKYAFDDPENLPDWFKDDQKQHYKKPLPVTKEELQAAREELKQFNAKPIKKVMEAIARRKKRVAQSLEKIRGKAEAIANQSDISEVTKIKEIRKLYSKQYKKNQKQKKYLVAKTHQTKNAKSLRRGNRGVKFVDKRLKKDRRAEKARKRRQQNNGNC